MSETPPVFHGAAPFIGADAEVVLGALLGLSQDETDRLAETKVVY